MSTSILKALQNANYNIGNSQHRLQSLPLVIQQLKNAVTLLEKGYGLEEEIEPLLEKYKTLENVPDKQ